MSQPAQQKIIDEFSQLATWDEKYKKIIDYGKKLAPLPEEHRTEKNQVKGCQSQVWLHAELTLDGKVLLVADSDALIVKGLVALLLHVYSGQTPQEILSSPPEFLRTLGFDQNLSPSRSNGLHAMIKQIKNYALVFDYLQKNKK
jgi:cysteine desulfuration protein SufE